MSVSPLPSVPEPSVPEPSDAQPSDEAPARLHLVPPHEHVWRLVAVDYDEGLEVRRYECADCADVLFR